MSDHRTWDEAARDARAALVAEWDPARHGTRSAVRALTAAVARLQEHAEAWEAAGWPDIGAPPDSVDALRAIQCDAASLRARALEKFESGDVDGAIDSMRAAIVELVNPELLPTLSTTFRSIGRFEEARLVMRAAVALYPHDDALRRTLATYDGAQPPPEGDDVSAEWLDPERRPKATAAYMMDSR